jgi:L-fuconolactonase
MIVDTHLHPLSDDMAAYPRLETSRFQGVNTVDETLAQMRLAGVDRVVLVQFFGVYGNDNSYVADCVEQHPESFAGVGCVDPFAPDAAASLTYWARERGLHALRLFAPRGEEGAERWPDSPFAYPLLECAQALGVPVCLSMQKEQVVHLPGLLQCFPSLQVLLDHTANVPMAGESDEALALMPLARHPNLLLKFSTQNFAATADPAQIAPFLRALVGAFGADRLMWGSNYPAG